MKNNPVKIPFSVDLSFRFHKRLLDPRVVKDIGKTLEAQGFSPSKRQEDGEIVPESIERLSDAHFTDYEARGQPFGKKLRTTAFPVTIDERGLEKAWCAFEWSVFKREEVAVGLTASISARPEEQERYQNALADKFLALAVKLYSTTHPLDGYLTDSDIDSNLWRNSSIFKQQIATLSWINFFGPNLVFYQSRRSIVVKDEIAHRRWQRDVTAYLASNGIQIRFGRM